MNLNAAQKLLLSLGFHPIALLKHHRMWGKSPSCTKRGPGRIAIEGFSKANRAAILQGEV